MKTTDRISATTHVVVVVLVSLAIGSTGCSGGGGGGGGGTGTVADSIAPGSWTGSISSSLAGNGVATLDITDVVTARGADSLSSIGRIYQTYVSGTWTADFGGQLYDNAGTVDGIFLDGNLDGTLDSYFVNGCSSEFSALVTDKGISGTSLTIDCSVNDSTSFNVDEISSGIVNIEGNWSGQLSSSAAGSGSIAGTIDQTGLNVTGSLEMSFFNSNFYSSGEFFGRINGSRVFLNYYPYPFSDCPFTATGNVGSNGAISGTFTAFDCSQNVSGNFSITRN